MDKIGLRHAIRGVFTALRLEKNMKIHFVAMLIVISVGMILEVTVIEWLFLIIAIGIVFIAELLNTSVEIITDQLFSDTHEKARDIKDISAGAVLVAAIVAAIIGVIIFLPRLINIL